MERTEKTINFIEHVDKLINNGVVKNYAEIIKALGWHKSTFSEVINGNINVPTHIYRKFVKVYEIPELEKVEVKGKFKDVANHDTPVKDKLLDEQSATNRALDRTRKD